jgi:hypothetical protein
MTRAALCLAILCLAASGAAAQATYDWTGVTTGADQSREFAVTPEHVVVLLHADYADVTLEDPEAPLNGAAGPCFGKAEIPASPPRATATASGATAMVSSPSAAGPSPGWPKAET